MSRLCLVGRVSDAHTISMSKKYHFWITGCQMNYADARRVATELEKRGYETTARSEDADVVILQTCTVRQQSEDKAYNKLH
jgi:tRNA-2-methylthio-N6-dimethylallyladenosine synthase